MTYDISGVRVLMKKNELLTPSVIKFRKNKTPPPSCGPLRSKNMSFGTETADTRFVGYVFVNRFPCTTHDTTKAEPDDELTFTPINDKALIALVLTYTDRYFRVSDSLYNSRRLDFVESDTF